jgi:hypothetical protein
MAWNAQRKADGGLLAVQFCTCIVSWTVVVLLIGGGVSGAGFMSSVITATVLVVVSWVLVKLEVSCGCNDEPRTTGSPSGPGAIERGP